MALSSQPSVILFLCPVSVDQEDPVSPTTASTSKLSRYPHPVTISLSQGMWLKLTLLFIFTPRRLKQRWGPLLPTASAPPAAPTRAAASGRSSSDWTSTCSLWVGWRAEKVRRSSACEWTAGSHRLCSHTMTQRQGNTRKTMLCKSNVFVMLCYFQVISEFLLVELFRRVDQH